MKLKDILDVSGYVRIMHKEEDLLRYGLKQ
jgi:hypothetical protein